MESFTKEEKGHGRKEVRTAYVCHDVSWQPGGRQWSKLTCIGAIQTRFNTKREVTEQWHYYISSKALTAEELLHHARMEWQVETMHWLLDVHFKEDKCRVLDKNVQQNLNMAPKLTLNIVKMYKRDNALKKALSGIMFDCLMSPLHILTVLGKNFSSVSICSGIPHRYIERSRRLPARIIGVIPSECNGLYNKEQFIIRQTISEALTSGNALQVLIFLAVIIALFIRAEGLIPRRSASGALILLVKSGMKFTDTISGCSFADFSFILPKLVKLYGLEQTNRILRMFGTERLIFGTDFPDGNYKEYFDILDAMDFSNDEKED